MVLSGLYARLCHAFLVKFTLPFKLLMLKLHWFDLLYNISKAYSKSATSRYVKIVWIWCDTNCCTTHLHSTTNAQN